RPGALVHEFHTTVSLIRTLEILLGLQPMNQLDAAASPIDVFTDRPDTRPYEAILPVVDLDNLTVAKRADPLASFWMKRSREQDSPRPDQADADTLNRAIWFSVRGDTYPENRLAHLPAFDLMLAGLRREAAGDEDDREELAERREEHP